MLFNILLFQSFGREVQLHAVFEMVRSVRKRLSGGSVAKAKPWAIFSPYNVTSSTKKGFKNKQ